MFETIIIPALIFAGVGLLAGVLLTIFSKIFAVETDERFEPINDALPQANCGACGYAGCSDYANAVLAGAEVNKCIPGGKKSADAIAEIMGVAAGEVESMVAFVRCDGSAGNTEAKYSFDGTQSCAAANRFYNGSEVCKFSCLGFGDCAKACPEDAITVKDRLARIDKAKCIGCGICSKVCPDHLIVIKPRKNHVDVACSSCAGGKETRSICKAGCIACKICEKKCPNDAIHVIDNVARIDYEKCTSCGICVAACPRKVIRDCNQPVAEVKTEAETEKKTEE